MVQQVPAYRAANHNREMDWARMKHQTIDRAVYSRVIKFLSVRNCRVNPTV